MLWPQKGGGGDGDVSWGGGGGGGGGISPLSPPLYQSLGREIEGESRDREKEGGEGCVV